jgi:hypothetical protein
MRVSGELQTHGTIDSVVRIVWFMAQEDHCFVARNPSDSVGSDRLSRTVRALTIKRRVGPPHRPDPASGAVRWGRQPGYVTFGGQKVAMPRPRVRTREGEGVRLDDHALRWAASGLLKAEKKFRRVKGYRELEVLHRRRWLNSCRLRNV